MQLSERAQKSRQAGQYCQTDMLLALKRLPPFQSGLLYMSKTMVTNTPSCFSQAHADKLACVSRRPVAQIDVADGAATGVTFADGRHLRAKAVVVNADPFRLQQLVGPQHLPAELDAQLDSQKIDGSVLKVGSAHHCTVLSAR